MTDQQTTSLIILTMTTYGPNSVYNHNTRWVFEIMHLSCVIQTITKRKKGLITMQHLSCAADSIRTSLSVITCNCIIFMYIIDQEYNLHTKLTCLQQFNGEC